MVFLLRTVLEKSKNLGILGDTSITQLTFTIARHLNHQSLPILNPKT